MKRLIVYINFITISYSTDIMIDVYPDSIFVGSLVTILVKVENMNTDEIAIFNDFDEASQEYININKILLNNAAQYTFQFWNSGSIILPPLLIDIKSHYNLQQISISEMIELFVNYNVI